MESKLIIAFFIIFCVSLLLNSTILKFVKTLGIRGKNNISVRWSAVTKPSLGGIIFYIIFLFTLVGFILIEPGFNITRSEISGLFCASSIAFMLGLADDAYNTNPFIKLSGQVACGVIFIATGNTIVFFNYPELDAVLTLLWVVGLMNSINMLDNMDGIATISVLGILFGCLTLSLFYFEFTYFKLFIMVAVIASLLAFLYYNFHPSKMFMGDTGSQFLGVITAYFSIQYIWDFPFAQTGINSHMYLGQAGLILVIFALPLTDTLTVTINRLYKGISPMVGGKDHTTHYLSKTKLGDKKTSLVFIYLSFFQVITVILFSISPKYIQWFIIGFFILYFLLLVYMGLYITRKERKLSKK